MVEPLGPSPAPGAAPGANVALMTYDDSPRVGLSEAAALTGLSVSTLRRRREALRAHGAIQRDDGSWAIPVHALIG
ncbi:hypothetical protein MOPEL_036_00220, partial [Mobilicoccus pelagius NBRC 104925]